MKLPDGCSCEIARSHRGFEVAGEAFVGFFSSLFIRFVAMNQDDEPPRPPRSVSSPVVDLVRDDLVALADV
jgi:hypothetical protein